MSQPCQRKVVYFADEFDIIPQIKVEEEKSLQESMDGGNHIPFARGGVKNKRTNLMSSRWAGSGGSQPKRDSIGRTRHLDSVSATPGDFNPTIKHKERFGKHVQHKTRMNSMRRSAKLQGTPEDEWLSRGRTFDTRNDRALRLHMPANESYDKTFNTPNARSITRATTNQMLRDHDQIQNQRMNMPFGSFLGMPPPSSIYNPSDNSQYDVIRGHIGRPGVRRFSTRMGSLSDELS